jgi:hypothetical protein
MTKRQAAAALCRTYRTVEPYLSRTLTSVYPAGTRLAGRCSCLRRGCDASATWTYRVGYVSATGIIGIYGSGHSWAEAIAGARRERP